MDYYVGIDVSLELSSVCIVDVAGKIVAEAKVKSHPDAIVDFLHKLGHSIERVGLAPVIRDGAIFLRRPAVLLAGRTWAFGFLTA